MIWFRRKPANRRLQREQVLEVKLRSSQLRSARFRMAAIALGVVFSAVFLVYLLWRCGDMALNRLVYENKAFAIRFVDIKTDGLISTDHLRRWAGIKAGENLLALDLARVKRDLELVPAIESAAVERILPATLRIRVAERIPIAQVNLPRPRLGGADLAVFHVDAAGYIMLPLDPRYRAPGAPAEPEQFPVISGVSQADVQPGRKMEAPQLHAALQLLQAFEGSPMAGLVELKKVTIDEPDVLVLTTGQGSEITLSLTDFDQQLRRWRDIFEMGQKLGKSIASLDLAISNNIPATWLAASGAPPAPPKVFKSTRTRKRNV